MRKILDSTLAVLSFLMASASLAQACDLPNDV